MQNRKTRVLITGICGFVSSHICEHFLKETDYEIIGLDKMNYASSGMDRLRDIKAFDENRVKMFAVDLQLPLSEGVIQEIGEVDYILNLASESIPENIYIPIQPDTTIGTQVMTFGELWEQQKNKNGTKVGKTEKGEVIFCKNKQTKALSFLNGGQWMPIKAITRHWYKGKIIKLIQKWGIVEATPNHSIYSSNLELTNPETNPELLVIRDINGRHKKKNKVSLALLEILAAYITEGNATFNKANGSYIIAISQNRKEWLENIGKLIKNELGLNSYISRHKKIGFKDVFELQISNKKFFNYIIDNCGKYCDGKFFPNWVFDLEPAQREFFWQKLLEGDGTKYGGYTTTSYKLSNQISLLLTLQGNKFTIYEYDREKCKRSWAFKTKSAGQHYGLNKNKKVEIDYEGWVYDLEIERTHNFVCGIGNVVCHNSHVDRSIADPVNFIENNVKLVLNMLEWARTLKGLKKFIQFSTDESYSEAPKGINYKEGDRHNPGNPYAASKSAQEMICRAYSNTYSLPINITNSGNIIGERQHPEKFVPLCINKINAGEVIKIHSNPEQTEAGSRFYLHARNIAKALQFILEETDEKLDKVDASLGCWNIIADTEINNLDMAKKIAGLMGKELKYELINWHNSARKGHELRYGLDGIKLKNAGFNYPLDLDESLDKTIKWMIAPENSKWLQ